MIPPLHSIKHLTIAIWYPSESSKPSIPKPDTPLKSILSLTVLLRITFVYLSLDAFLWRVNETADEWYLLQLLLYIHQITLQKRCCLDTHKWSTSESISPHPSHQTRGIFIPLITANLIGGSDYQWLL